MISCVYPGMDIHHPHHVSIRQILEITLWIVSRTVLVAGEELSNASTKTRLQILSEILLRVYETLEEKRFLRTLRKER